jgi:molybdenum cofactor biosynthesis enzyme MoaA
MKRCLDKALIERLINHLILTHVKDAEIQQLVENCKNWEEQIVIINYLLTQIIQKKIKKGSLPSFVLAGII